MPRRGPLVDCLRQFKSPLIYLLLAAAVALTLLAAAEIDKFRRRHDGGAPGA